MKEPQTTEQAFIEDLHLYISSDMPKHLILEFIKNRILLVKLENHRNG